MGGEQVKGALIIGAAVNAELVPLAGGQAHLVEAVHILAGLDDHIFAFCKANIVACLGFHRHQEVFFGGRQVNQHGAGGLDGVRRGPEPGQVVLNEALRDRLPYFRFDPQKDGMFLAAQGIQFRPESGPIPAPNRAARHIGHAQPERQGPEQHHGAQPPLAHIAGGPAEGGF